MTPSNLPAWRKIRTVSWFLYGSPDAYLVNLDSMSWLVMKVPFEE